MIEILLDSLKQIWKDFIGFLPTLLAALIVFIIGWLISIFLGKLVNRVIKTIKLDLLLSKLGFQKALSRARIKLDSGLFLGGLVKWFFIIVFLMAAVDILGLTQITLFLKSLLYYLPSVVIAAVILLAAVVISKFMQRLVKASADAADLASSGAIAGIVKWAILIFGFVIALNQLGIAIVLIQQIIVGIIAMIAIAGGLAFGLGGKDLAGRILERIRQDLSEK